MAKFQTIRIGEIEHPISFGTMALANFCKKQGLSLKELNAGLQDKLDLFGVIDLVHAGLQDGYRKAKKDFTLTEGDVADIFDEYPNSMEKFFAVFGDEMPQSKTGKAEAEGK